MGVAVRRISPLFCFLLFSVCFVTTQYQDLIFWKYQKTPFISDAYQYYYYLPSTFIPAVAGAKLPSEYWPIATPLGKNVPKMTMGVAILEAPFFFNGDYLAKKLGYERDGFSAPYIWSNYVGVILYVFLGLCFLYKALRVFFKPIASALTVFSVFYATNLLYYTVSMGQMSHSFSFSLFCVFVYAVVKWGVEKRGGYLFLAAVVGGLITLVRPPDISVMLMIPLAGIYNLETLKDRWRYLCAHILELIAAALLFIFTISPQLIYWKMNTGSCFFYTYGSEKFFFSDPQILNFLFSYRKGLFAYTPVMFLAFLGFIPLCLRWRQLFWAVLVFVAIDLFVLSSWWDWTYSGGFGSRAFIQGFAVLAFPLTALFGWVIDLVEAFPKKTLVVLLLAATVYLFSSLNIVMTRQYNYGWIHYSDMTKESYWYIFNKSHMTKEENEHLQKLFKPMDAEAMMRGERN